MGQSMTIRSSAGNFNAYIARPTDAQKATACPAIVVVQEIFGINSDMRDTCDELAARGYIAVCPDLFWRVEPGVDMSDQTEAEWNRAFALYKAFDIDVGVLDIAATLQVARSVPGTTGKVGLMGYCLGGLMTFLTTARLGADAAVSFYPGGTERHLKEADTIGSPLLMHLAEDDEYISTDAQREIRDALESRPTVRIYSYPNCKHAFARHRGIHFDAAAAALANRRTFDFLSIHLCLR